MTEYGIISETEVNESLCEINTYRPLWLTAHASDLLGNDPTQLHDGYIRWRGC